MMDKLSYYEQNNHRVCENCFEKCYSINQELLNIQHLRRTNPSSFISKVRPINNNQSAFSDISSFKTELRDLQPNNSIYGNFGMQNAQTPGKFGYALHKKRF